MFNPGDLVRLTEKLADGKINLRYIGHEKTVWKFLKDYPSEFYDRPIGTFECVEGNGIIRTGVRRNWYYDRFELIKQEIAVGCIVKYTGKDGAIIRNGAQYTCQDLKDGKIKLEGVRNWMNLNQFVWAGKAVPAPPPIEKDKGEKLLEDLKEQVDKKAVGTCSYVIEWTNGKRNWHVGDVCHARIAREYRDDNAGNEIAYLALNISKHYEYCPEDEKEAYKTYIDWLVNRSFIKNAFIPRKIDDILKDGVLMNVEHNIDIVAIGAILTRHVTEFPGKRSIFGKVVDLGFSEELGLFVSTFFDIKEDSVILNSFGGGHHVFSNEMDAQQLLDFFKKGVPEKDEKNPYKTNHKRYAVFKTISPLYSTVHAKKVSKFCAENMKGIIDIRGQWANMLKGYKGPNALVKTCAALAKFF